MTTHRHYIALVGDDPEHWELSIDGDVVRTLQRTSIDPPLELTNGLPFEAQWADHESFYGGGDPVCWVYRSRPVPGAVVSPDVFYWTMIVVGVLGTVVTAAWKPAAVVALAAFALAAIGAANDWPRTRGRSARHPAVSSWGE